ncbi:MAG: nucleotidyl transferase AbiEii/AbiGii toxin family protein, partial [Deltaproteobacteria bacterium]|nr:nucleotidyl transferase AbiEii/AbiGii toxin family protein [Deltaproteobacteria bacterium]
MKLILTILDKKRQKVIKELSKYFSKDFYLGGGTALSLQIAHRESYDFDLFSEKPISFNVKQRLKSGFNKHNVVLLVDTKDELSVIIDEDIKVTFMNFYWKPIFPLIKSDRFLPLLSIQDIAANKAFAIGRRANYRDYYDLYILIKNKHLSISELIEISIKKFGDFFSERMFIEQLIYLEDITPDENLRFLREEFVSKKEIQRFFKRELKNWLKKKV